MPTLFQNSLVYIQAETTEGTDAVPAVTDALEVYDFVPRNATETRQRLILQPTFSKVPHVVSRQIVSCTFKVELKHYAAILTNDASDGLNDPSDTPPSGGPTKIVELFRALGFTAAFTKEVTPDTSADGYVILTPETVWPALPTRTPDLPGSLSIYWNMGGTITKVRGARGNASINITAGEFMVLDVELFGLLVEPPGGSSAVPAGTFDTISPAIVQSTSFTWGTYTAGTYPDLTINFNNQVIERNDIQSASGGLKSYRISDRDIGGTINTEAEHEESHASDAVGWFTDGLAGTERAVVISQTHSGDDGIILTMPVVQVMPDYQESEGLNQYALAFNARGNAAAGDDELSIRLGNIVL